MKRIVLLTIVVLFCALNSFAQITAIKAGKLVMPETGTTLNNQIILVEGQKIKAVGGDVQIPNGSHCDRFIKVDGAAGTL